MISHQVGGQEIMIISGQKGTLQRQRLIRR